MACGILNSHVGRHKIHQWQKHCLSIATVLVTFRNTPRSVVLKAGARSQLQSYSFSITDYHISLIAFTGIASQSSIGQADQIP